LVAVYHTSKQVEEQLNSRYAVMVTMFSVNVSS